ncbi:DUF4303 domain-containing protein [Leucobacter komagatae]|uniref:DUF4303 domain-containing protein n=1 Tax=Leucobacter komagatae TaxID=55969 RepID=A0A0D0I1D8_9MICO|nr:DUF4303 domain-containing protein [Leucobacter komagatae]KIP53541.1 hypothetical protein SD72_02365 [Leucobacter komagatae]
MALDTQALVTAAAAQLVEAVRSVRAEHPGETIYGAMFHEFYGDGTVIYWPMVTVGTEESLAEVVASYTEQYGAEDHGTELHGTEPGLADSLRWSGPDLAHSFEPSPELQALADGVQVSAGSGAKWEGHYERWLRCFPKAAKLARKELVAEGIVPKSFVAVAADEAGELIPLSLTKSQLVENFPEYDEAEQERRRLAALPITERVAELLPEAVTPRYQGPLIGEHEGLLVACGEAALPALVSVVRHEALARGDVVAARLLAEINIDTPEVIEALEGLMLRRKAQGNSRAWAASALARLGRSDLILRRVAELPVDVVTRGIADPLSSFRDRGAHRPLDYAPLEQVLHEHPELEPAFEEELRPGVGYCALLPGEIPTAKAALDSRWPVVRVHAAAVLEDAGVKI